MRNAVEPEYYYSDFAQEYLDFISTHDIDEIAFACRLGACGDAGGSPSGSNGQGGVWKYNSDGSPISYTVTLEKGETWTAISLNRKLEILKGANDYILNKTAETGHEWGYTISLKGNNVIMSNFKEGSDIDVAPNFIVPTDQIVVGFAHTHPTGRISLLNSVNDASFSYQDIWAIANANFRIKNIEMNGFTAFTLQGKKTTSMTVTNHNSLISLTLTKQFRDVLKIDPNRSFNLGKTPDFYKKWGLKHEKP